MKCLGRPCDKDEEKDEKDKKEEKKDKMKMDDFHILDYEPDMTEFVYIAEGWECIVAIDSDGEIWILCGN